MNSAGLQIDSQHPTGTVEVRFEQGEPAYDIVAGRAYDCIAADSLPQLTPALIYHCTLALRAATSLQALETLNSRYNTPVFLDVNLRPPWWELQAARKLLDNARWVKLNEDELSLLGTDSGTLDQRAARLRETHGNELLIVTRGGDGAVAFSSDGQSAATRPGSDNRVVDTVGAGDTFNAGLIDALAKGGMTFMNAYANAPNCAPSRACLMSGQYSPRHGVYTVGSAERGGAKYRKLIPIKNSTTLDPKFITLAEALQSAGRTSLPISWCSPCLPMPGCSKSTGRTSIT